MNIEYKKIDKLNAEIIVNVEKNDYEENVNKRLNDIKKEFQMPGFRRGKVPIGFINKIYGTSVKIDEIYNLIQKSINDYIVNEKIDILGYPIPSEKQQKLDIENGSSFEFVFDIGLKPKFDIKLSQKDKFVNYEIIPNDEIINNYIDSYRKYFGSYVKTENVDDDCLIITDLFEIDSDGNVIENGIKSENANIFIKQIKDDNIKNTLLGLKVNDSVTFNPKNAFQDDYFASYILKVKGKNPKAISSNYKLVIKEIKKFENAPIDKKLYDLIFGENVVNTEEEFREKIIEKIKEDYKKELNNQLTNDIIEYFIDKVKIDLPSEFLRRWILFKEEKVDKEDLEKNFSIIEEDIKWQLIKEKIAENFNIKVEEQDLIKVIKDAIRFQFQNFGITNPSEELLDNYANNYLKDKKSNEVDKFYEIAFSEKIFNIIKENCRLDKKEITIEEYKKILEKKEKRKK